MNLTLPRILTGLFCLIVLLGTVYLVQQTQLLQRFRLILLEWQTGAEEQSHALRLGDYWATIQGLPIAGIDAEVSALTYDSDRKSLVGLTNQDPHLFELSLSGQLLRKLPLVGFSDPESIVYIRPNVYVIADERKQRLIKIELSDHTTVIEAAQAEHLTLALDAGGNKGFEGLAYDAAGQRLFVAQERDPIQILEVRGFPFTPGQSAVQVTNDEARNKRLQVRDLSGLQYSAKYDHLLVLSDQSQMVLELNTQNEPIGGLLLRQGLNGLTENVPQAEGIALDDAGRLYIVSEPNLFYRFEKKVAR